MTAKVSRLGTLAGPYVPATGGHMKQSDHFRENAENCAQLTERASDSTDV